MPPSAVTPVRACGSCEATELHHEHLQTEHDLFSPVSPCVAAAGCPLALQSSAHERGSWPIVEQAPVQKSIPLAAATRLVVDNVWGAIEVTAWDGATIELRATRTTRARTAADRDTASREVVLDVSQTGSDVILRVRRAVPLQLRRAAIAATARRARSHAGEAIAGPRATRCSTTSR